KIRRRERPALETFKRRFDVVGTVRPPREEGVTVSLDPRGPGLEGTRPRGTILRPGTPFPAAYFPPWTPPSPVTPRTHGLTGVEEALRGAIGGKVVRDPGPTDTVTWIVRPDQLVPALAHLRPRFRRLEYACGIDDRPRGGGFRTVYHLAAIE